MRFVLTTVALAFFGSVTQVGVQADPITYALTTTASGTLGASPFTDAPITLVFTGNTSNITAGSAAHAGTLSELGSGIVIISGLGAATLTDPSFMASTFDNVVALFGESGVIIGDNTNGTGILGAFGPFSMAMIFKASDRLRALEV